MSAPWWVRDRGELEMQIALLILEALVSFQIALMSLLLIPVFVGWDTMVDERMAWVGLVWLMSAFAIVFGLFIRAHWKSLNGGGNSEHE